MVIRNVGEKVLDKISSEAPTPQGKETWWRNDEVQEKIKNKKETKKKVGSTEKSQKQHTKKQRKHWHKQRQEC